MKISGGLKKNKTVVVVVEDEPSLLMAIDFKLKKIGYEVFTAETGEKGLELIKEKKPALIWADLLLPGMNGIELLRKIKKEPELKKIPFVIVSVSAGPDKIKEAFSLGATDYIVKSNYHIDEIIERVIKLIKV
ncbi:MAG: response regulator [bacterium]|nr:response regulator [bacterium]